MREYWHFSLRKSLWLEDTGGVKSESQFREHDFDESWQWDDALTRSSEPLPGEGEYYSHYTFRKNPQSKAHLKGIGSSIEDASFQNIPPVMVLSNSPIDQEPAGLPDNYVIISRLPIISESRWCICKSFCQREKEAVEQPGKSI
jgi:hypothetical protein